MSETATTADRPWEKLPAGEYAIVEILGHTTLVGRVDEVERFGAKMLAIEALFKGQLLPAVFQGGTSIYRFTPVPAHIAWERHPQEMYQLPIAMRCIVPETLLAAPDPAPTVDHEHDHDQCKIDRYCSLENGHPGPCNDDNMPF